jgi:hypothetical protein
MHNWSDKSVDWEGIGSAADEIGHFISRWGRITVSQTKEKWGMSCVYCYGPVNFWQRFIYRLAYKLAIRKRPHLREELLNGADWDEYLEDL